MRLYIYVVLCIVFGIVFGTVQHCLESSSKSATESPIHVTIRLESLFPVRTAPGPHLTPTVPCGAPDGAALPDTPKASSRGLLLSSSGRS